MNDRDVDSLPAAISALEAPSDQSLRVPCYCEENVWRLAYRRMHQQVQDDDTKARSYHVAFVSNPKGCVPMFEQVAADDRETPVLWDYHVILFMTTTSETRQGAVTHKAHVLDIDSHLPYPCPMDFYIEMVFPNQKEWPDKYLPYFRVIDGKVFLRHFSSDRSHMYDSETKSWSSPPPKYDCILPPAKIPEQHGGATVSTTFEQYSTISNQNVVDSQQQQEGSEENPYGRIYSLSQLVQRFGIREEPMAG